MNDAGAGRYGHVSDPAASPPGAEPVVTDHPDRSRYELTIDGHQVGLIDYQIADGVISLLHEEVDPALEGRGLGSMLARGALDDVRAHGLAVRPVCPFVAAFIERHRDEYGDLLA